MGVLTEKSANVAFEIPVDELGTGSKSPRIQKKLENWKPPSPTKADVESKVITANQRRQEQLASHTTKIGKHNVRVQKACREKRAAEAAGKSSLEDRIRTKLNGASEKRGTITRKLVKRLTLRHKEKHDRGEKALRKEAEALEELENRVELKLASATERKEKKEKSKVVKISTKVQSERAKASIALQKAEATAKQLDAAIEAKLTAAADRKDIITTEKIESLAHETHNKMERGKAAIEKQEATARDLDTNIENRLKAAASRREKTILSTVRNISETEQEKLDRAFDARRRREDAKRMLDEINQRKLTSADMRKNNMIAKTVEQAFNSNKVKQNRAAQKAAKDQADARCLLEKIDTKLAEATERKAEHLTSAVKQAKAKKSPSQAASCLSPCSPSKEEIDERLNNAAIRRETYLRTRSSSSRKTRPHSNTASPSNSDQGSAVGSPRDAIESRMNEAAARREALLMQKAEQAGFYANRGQPRGHSSNEGGALATPTRRNIDGALEMAEEAPPQDREVLVLDHHRAEVNPVVRLFFDLASLSRNLFVSFFGFCLKGR